MEYNQLADKYIKEVVELVEYKEDSSDLEKQVFGAFIFGVMNGILEENMVEPVVVHASLLDQLILELKYHPDEAAQFAEFLIQSTDRDFNPTMNIIIHRGINAYYDLIKRNRDAVKNNYNEIISVVENE